MTMPDTPALAARREAERGIIHRAAVAMEQYRIAQLPPRPANSMGFDDKERYAQFKNIQRYEREIRDAVAARAREELLFGAPTVWVATDSGASVSDLADALGIPPGTVRRYALVPIEEEETPT